ncbi:MAG: YIP1 family protein [Candidatus Aenigmatarchaeota archaeon]
MIDFKLWKDALLKPKQTFKKQKPKADLGVAMKNVAIAGLITGIIMGLVELNLLSFAFNIVFYPIVMVVSLLLNSLLYHVFARLLGGKGNYNTQTYLIALYSAPMSIMSSIVSIPLLSMTEENLFNNLPVLVLVVIASMVVGIYSLYLLIQSLKETHSISTGRAFLTAIVPALLLMLLIIAGVLVYYGLFMPAAYEIALPSTV